MKHRFSVSSLFVGWRLDKCLAQVIPSMSRSAIQVAISQGRAQVNGAVISKKGYILAQDDRVELEEDEVQVSTRAGDDMPIDIRYEDEWLLVVNKPVGLVVHPAPGHPRRTLVNGLLAYGASLSNLGEGFRPGIVHRLDKDTSGLLLVAKTNASHLRLAAMFKAKVIERIYLALLSGKLSQRQGRIRGPIGRHPRRRTSMAIVEKGKPAETDFRVLRYFQHHTLVEVRLQTGRTHQIRVHFAHLGRPVVGDQVYGQGDSQRGLTGHMLHARTLRFTHPFTNKNISITAEPPQEYLNLLRQLSEDLVPH